MIDSANTVLSFGEFELDPDRRLLLRDGEKVPLKAKAFDLLLTFVERPGEVLSKNELLDTVWKDQFVEENNLTVHVAALRKALGETKNEHRYIVTVPGTGYRFVADVRGPSSGEVIVERRSLSRIVVEEEFSESNAGDDHGESRYLIPQRYRLAAAVIGSMLIAAIGGGWYYGSHLENAAQRASTATVPRFSAKVFATAGGGVPERVTISPDGKTIAFVERKKGQYALRLGEIEANNSLEIVPFQERLYRHLAFAPDGKSIYFTARDANHFEPGLMRVSILGGAVQDVAPNVGSTFTFSPDGKSIAFLRNDPATDRSSIVLVATATGQAEKEIFIPDLPKDVLGAGVAWSPDSELIAFASPHESGSRLMAVGLSDSRVFSIGETVPNRIVNIAWMPDGSGLLVNRNTEPQPNDGHIWFVDYRSGEGVAITDEILTYSFASLSASSDKKIAIIQTRSDPKIVASPTGEELGAEPVLAGSRARGEGMNGVVLAPDGKILFTAVVNDSRVIWEMNPDGSQQRQLTTFHKGSADGQINATPDNRYLVFESERTGALEVWRANRDGSDAKPLTDGGRNSQPALSPDGLWIIYSSLRNGEYGLRRISIDGGESSAITNEESVWPDISPDGRTIAYAHGGTARDPSREIRIIPVDGGEAIRSFPVPLTGVLYNRLRWSPDGRAIFYKDHTQGLWRQDLSSDKPVEVPSADDLRVFHFSFSPTGSILYSAGTQMREIVILESTN